MGTIISLSPNRKKTQSNIEALLEKGWELRTYDSDKAFKLSQEALEWCEENNYDKGKALAIRNISFINTKGLTNQNAAWRLEEALTIFRTGKHQTGIADCYRIKGLKLVAEKKYKEALTDFLKAFEIYKLENNAGGTAFTLSDIGNLYATLKAPKTALTYYIEAMAYKEQGNDHSFHKPTLLNNTGLVYSELNLFKQAQTYFSDSLKLSTKLNYKQEQARSLQLLGELKLKETSYAEALRLQQKSLKAWKQLGNLSGVADSYYNIGLSRLAQRKYKEGGSSFLKALLIYEKTGNKDKTVYTELQIASVKLKTGQLSAAEKLLNRALNRSIGLNDLKAILNTHQLYAEYFEQIAHHENILYHTRQALTTLNAIAKAETVRRANQIELILFTDKRHKEIEESNFHNQKALELSEVLKVKKDILRYASHDLKSPLNSIKGLINLMSNSYNNKRQIKEYTSLIEEAADQMLNLINDIQQASMVESGFMEYKPILFDLVAQAKLCANSFLVQTQAKKQTIVVSATKPFFVYADREKISSVLTNLISNASKFSYLNQRITISFSSAKGVTRCMVKDQGQGLTKTDIKDAFQQFKKLSAHPTNSEETIGLGLFICKKLIETNKGRIWIESEGKNKGSKFIFELPNHIELNEN